MDSAPRCSRCGGLLEPGKLRHFLEYGGAATHYYCPWDKLEVKASEAGTGWREIAVWCCQGCGSVEMFAGPPETD